MVPFCAHSVPVSFCCGSSQPLSFRSCLVHCLCASPFLACANSYSDMFLPNILNEPYHRWKKLSGIEVEAIKCPQREDLGQDHREKDLATSSDCRFERQKRMAWYFTKNDENNPVQKIQVNYCTAVWMKSAVHLVRKECRCLLWTTHWTGLDKSTVFEIHGPLWPCPSRKPCIPTCQPVLL